jgi:hypothetical protein
LSSFRERPVLNINQSANSTISKPAETPSMKLVHDQPQTPPEGLELELELEDDPGVREAIPLGFYEAKQEFIGDKFQGFERTF